jgi:hypothetical protein
MNVRLDEALAQIGNRDTGCDGLIREPEQRGIDIEARAWAQARQNVSDSFGIEAQRE